MTRKLKSCVATTNHGVQIYGPSSKSSHKTCSCQLWSRCFHSAHQEPSHSTSRALGRTNTRGFVLKTLWFVTCSVFLGFCDGIGVLFANLPWNPCTRRHCQTCSITEACSLCHELLRRIPLKAMNARTPWSLRAL